MWRREDATFWCPWREKEEARERIGGEGGGAPRAGEGSTRDWVCAAMRDDTVLQRVDGRRFCLWEWDRSVASGGDTRAVCIRWRGGFRKMSSLQTKRIDGLYMPLELVS
jgi:hypothetical protein